MQTLLNSRVGGGIQARSGAGLLRRITHALALRRSRARLATLDAHLLDDIGLDRKTAEAEANRPIWDAPASWLK